MIGENQQSGILANKMRDIKSFHVMDLLEQARKLEAAGRSIIHMEIGEPDFGTPAPIIQAAHKALNEGKTRYTTATGLAGLKKAIANYYSDSDGVQINCDRIIITPGASGALLLSASVMINPGDEVLITDPGYPCNRNIIRLLNGTVKAIPVDAHTAFQLTASLVKEHWGSNTKALMLATPSNPTGSVISENELRDILDFVEQKNGGVIVDEIYHGLIYEQVVHSAVQFSTNAFVINSFSKHFMMTGWRLGWLVAPEIAVDALKRLAQNLFLAAPTIAQYAALAAFSEETRAIIEFRKSILMERRDFLISRLKALGFSVPVKPQGAFYVYADCSMFTADSFKFCTDVLQRSGVAITPGLDFGEHRAECYVRFAYTTDIKNIEEGTRRLKEYLTAG